MNLVLGLVFLVFSACSAEREIDLDKLPHVHGRVRVEMKSNKPSADNLGGIVSASVFSSSEIAGLTISVNYRLVGVNDYGSISWLIGSPDDVSKLVDGGVFRFSSTERYDGLRQSLVGGYLVNDAYTRQCRYLHQVHDRILLEGVRCQVIIPDRGLLYIAVIPGEFSGYEGEVINEIDVLIKNIADKNV